MRNTHVLKLRAFLSTACMAIVIAVGLSVSAPSQARNTFESFLLGQPATVAVGQLPIDAQETFRLIQQGGPFRYDKDGVVFSNFERALPRKPRGYYHEYTVKTPRSEGGNRTRGARRIVCGGDQTAANECYYTDDHYNSFKRITL